MKMCSAMLVIKKIRTTRYHYTLARKLSERLMLPTKESLVTETLTHCCWDVKW